MYDYVVTGSDGHRLETICSLERLFSRAVACHCSRRTLLRNCSENDPIAKGKTMATDVKAHITGTVWKVEVSVGDKVNEGDTVVILESMKMEMPVEAPCSGTVKEIRVSPNSPVEEGAVLLVIE